MKVLMLTLQNDPPSLDSGTEDKKQFEAYGQKYFRQAIMTIIFRENFPKDGLRMLAEGEPCLICGAKFLSLIILPGPLQATHGRWAAQTPILQEQGKG